MTLAKYSLQPIPLPISPLGFVKLKPSTVGDDDNDDDLDDDDGQ